MEKKAEMGHLCKNSWILGFISIPLLLCARKCGDMVPIRVQIWVFILTTRILTYVRQNSVCLMSYMKKSNVTDFEKMFYFSPLGDIVKNTY